MQKNNNLQEIFLTKARKQSIPPDHLSDERLSTAGRGDGL